MTDSARDWLSARFDVRLPALSVWPTTATDLFVSFCRMGAISSRMARPLPVSVALPSSNSMVRLPSTWSTAICSDTGTRRLFLMV
ncbi:hypothetical protein D9M72_228320 [compost metagenome]